MNNKHILPDILQAYLDRALLDTEHKEVSLHLEECPTCQDELARQERIISRLENLPDIKLNKDLSQAVIAQLKDEAKLSLGITWTLILEALAAGTVISFLIPAFRAAPWLPRLIDTQIEIQAAINIFLTQLASSWLVWWAGLRLNFVQFTKSFLTSELLPVTEISPWIMIMAAAGIGILANYFLLRIDSLGKQNHNQ